MKKSEKNSKKFVRDDVSCVSQIRLHDGFLKLDSLTVTHPCYEGSEMTLTREVVNNRDAVGVLLVDVTSKEVALVEQFRIGAYIQKVTSPWLIELVAGVIEDGESPNDVAIREVYEEAGVNVDRLIPISNYFSSPGGATQIFHLFCAVVDLSSVSGVHGLKDEGEDILVKKFSIDDVYETILTQHIGTSHTIIALQWLREHLSSLCQDD
jgi:ADP-ribose pyrophosphatase